MIETLGQIGACLSDPWGCFTAPLWAWATGLDWYWYAVAAVLVVGLVWKLAGWPGLLALGSAVSFLLGRFGRLDSSKEDDIYPDPDKRPSPYETPKVRTRGKVRTIFDYLKR